MEPHLVKVEAPVRHVNTGQVKTIEASARERVIGLDILRSIAILLVMHEHSIKLLGDKAAYYLQVRRPSIDGVSVFFVLSGFLIGGILLKVVKRSAYQPKDVLNFWIRRWMRTLPNYLFVLLLLLACTALTHGDTSAFSYKYFLFIQNLTTPHPLFFPEAWSLSIEEWFYLLFPIFVLIFYRVFRKKRFAVLSAAVFFLVLPLALRIWKYTAAQGAVDWDEDFRKIIILRLDSLMYGVLGAFVAMYFPEFWKKFKWVGLWLSAALIAFLFLYSAFGNPGGLFLSIFHYNIESISVLFAMPYFSTLLSIRNKSLTFIFTFISLISYSMYLINLSLVKEIAVTGIVKMIGLTHGQGSLMNVFFYTVPYILFWVLTITISYCLYRWLEQPVMKLRDKMHVA